MTGFSQEEFGDDEVTGLDDASLLDDSQDEAELREVVVTAAQHLSRADKALAELVPEFSRSYLQQLMGQGAVFLNNKPVTKTSQKAMLGDRLRVEMRPTAQSQAFRAEDIPLEVVYEDDHLLVVNKPAGLVVHPAPGNWSGTLLNALLGRDPKAVTLPRAGIVHRLDKDTSGLMVVARTRQVMDALVQLIAAREVSRQYIALAWRPWPGADRRMVNAPIGRDPKNRLRMAVVDLARTPGKAARTDFDRLATNDEACLVQCTLHTGRTHQIRVHMASLMHPLVGDALYGGAPRPGMERQALHAFRLAFSHPVTQEALEFRSSVPPDIAAACENWGLSYNLA